MLNTLPRTLLSAMLAVTATLQAAPLSHTVAVPR